MQRLVHNPNPRPSRRGLAPLEFVAALPFIVFLAALMVVVGGAGLVKSRAEINARYAMTRTAGPLRDPGNDPNPRNWERPATVTAGSGSQLSNAEAIWETMPDDLAIRGGGNFRGVRVDGLLEIGSSVHTGEVRYRRPIPMLRKVTSKNEFDVDLVVETVDNEWQYYAPGMRLGSNTARRGDPWYSMDPTELGGATASQRASLLSAQNEMKAAGLSPDIDALDDDPELSAHFGSPPDFHPSIGGCTSSILGSPEHNAFQQAIVRVPVTMADRHIRMYSEKMAANPGQESFWQDKIDQMTRFRDRYERLAGLN